MFALLLLMVAGNSYARDTSFTLVYSGNLDGELEPCGCTLEGDFGGLRRRATVLDKLRKKGLNPVVISSGGLLAKDFSTDRLKNEYILKGFKLLDYDAIGLQWDDLIFGIDALAGERLPWVASNWKGDRFLHDRPIERNGRRIAFFAWLNPLDSPYRKMQGRHDVVTDDSGRLQQRLANAKQNHAVTLLATSMPLAGIEEQLPLANVDILIVQSAYENFGKPQLVGKSIVLQPGSRGMRLGRLDITTDEMGSIVNWRHEVIPLSVDVADAARMQSWYDEYNLKVKDAYQESVRIRKQHIDENGPFEGDKICANCHAQIHKNWAGSDHAQAYNDLEKVDKAFDPACLRCHTLGFGRPGGFIDLDTTPELVNVQCESCHGGGREHVLKNGKARLPNSAWPKDKICHQCHTHDHSPSFAVTVYWPKIAH